MTFQIVQVRAQKQRQREKQLQQERAAREKDEKDARKKEVLLHIIVFYLLLLTGTLTDL